MAANRRRAQFASMGTRIVMDCRGIWRRGLMGAAAAVVGLKMDAARAQTKVTKKQAGYVPRSKGSQNCGSCGYFSEPNNCVLVEGPISPSSWCSYDAP